MVGQGEDMEEKLFQKHPFLRAQGLESSAREALEKSEAEANALRTRLQELEEVNPEPSIFKEIA